MGKKEMKTLSLGETQLKLKFLKTNINPKNEIHSIWIES